ncbi:MAG: TonB-dependent receptor, partial [Bryobacterales bacterium]|nr:TonB-dependent receptor [Bryobacterales bacterium]
PGLYEIHCSREGYVPVLIAQFPLRVRDRKVMSVELTPAATAALTTPVLSTAQGISGSIDNHTALDGEFIRYLPVAGRNLAALPPLGAGVVTGTRPSSGGVDHRGGAYFVNGLRAGTSLMLVDGVSVNGGLQGHLAGVRGIASGDWPLSLDAAQELKIQSLSVDPEFGRSPGAQVVVRSRSGGEEMHGSLYGIFRNRALAANHWFANAAGVNQPAWNYQNAGATLGGALLPRRTFYFVSYEALWGKLPQTSLTAVPGEDLISAAGPALTPFLRAFPTANGAASGSTYPTFTGVTTSSVKMHPISGRLDHRPSSTLATFFRYGYSPADTQSRGNGHSSANMVSRLDSRNHSFTGAATWTPASGRANDLRVNYSSSTLGFQSSLDEFGGAVPIDLSTFVPEGIDAALSYFELNIPGLGGYAFGPRTRNRQEQIHVADSFTLTERNHTFQFGVDYRRLFSTITQPVYSASITFAGLGDAAGMLLSGTSAASVIATNEPTVYPDLTQFSMYAQDTMRISERLTLLYGLRWEVNPAPGVRRGPNPVSYLADDTLNRFDPLYQTTRFDVAPRAGLAYLLDTTAGKELVFRAGIGLFREPGYASSTAFIGGAPFSAQRILSNADFPLTEANLEAPGLPAQRPYGQVNVTDPYLSSPRILQWSAGFERMLGEGELFSIAYVGTQGRDLLRTESLPQFTSSYTILRITSNDSESDYHGLQLRYLRPMGKSLSAQVSYTWAHAIDTGSEDHSAVLPGFATSLGTERGNADFDARHVLGFAGTYHAPAPGTGVLRTLLKDWSADWMLNARTALPFDVRTVSATTSSTSGTIASGSPGLHAVVRANYLGQQSWLSTAGVPGARALNPDAFAIPADYGQGTLGRNTLRGFAMWQADVALRRQIQAGERWKLHLQAQVFNLFNRQNLADPSVLQGALLGSPLFGLSTGLAGASQAGGFSGAFGQTGPRTLQFGLRVEF